MNNLLKYSAFSMLLVIVIGCTEDITQSVGPLPDETPMDHIGSQLYSGKTFSNMITINMYEDDEPAIEEIGYALTKPAKTAVTVKAIPSPVLVAQYNLDHNTKMEEFPISNIVLDNDGSLTVPAGKKASENINMTLSAEGLKPSIPYLLAITLTQNAAGIETQVDKQVIYYRISFQEKTTTCEPGSGGQIQEIPPLLPNVTSVFYVNTETYQPSIVSAWGVKADDFMTYPTPLFSIGNIVNLKRATIGYNTTSQRTLLELGSDLSYVLEHRDKYIRHLQEYKRKVCLCIENGGKGIGFCNMNDTQIADFVRQVKDVIDRYYLDGVNLWDEDSKYDKTGMAKMNTTSYPRLIKALREILPGKILTLVDKGDATEYFHDVKKCGNIEVGHYIDYAWHGYFSPTEELQIINPNPEGSAQKYSKYTRKPIAGLDETCYGSVILPRYPKDNHLQVNSAAKAIAQWKTLGNKKSDILVFGDDLIGQEYGDREGAVRQMLDGYSFLQFMNDGDSWDFNINDVLWGDVEYGAGLLDYRLGTGADNNIWKKDW